jgi:polyhydroxybutyrate depolymerase
MRAAARGFIDDAAPGRARGLGLGRGLSPGLGASRGLGLPLALGLAVGCVPFLAGVASLGCGGSAASAAGQGGVGATSQVGGAGGAGGAGASQGAASQGAQGGGGAGGAGGQGAGGAGGAGGAPQGCLPPLAAGHHVVSCAGGIDYDVELPAACVGGGCGLVVDLHGYTMTADTQDESTQMRALGQQHGYVVVQPTAPSDAFGQPSWDQPSHTPLVAAFVQDLVAALSVDPARVHAMGFSQGGGMTLRLLCDHAHLFASVAPIAALQGCPFAGPGTPSEEVDVLMVHGRADAVVNFYTVALPQRDAALAAWPFGPPEVLTQAPMLTATRWTTTGGTRLELWEHDYTTLDQAFFVTLYGHCVPGGQDLDGEPAGYSCEDQGTFVFGELAMQFFLEHPKGP